MTLKTIPSSIFFCTTGSSVRNVEVTVSHSMGVQRKEKKRKERKERKEKKEKKTQISSHSRFQWWYGGWVMRERSVFRMDRSWRLGSIRGKRELGSITVKPIFDSVPIISVTVSMSTWTAENSDQRNNFTLYIPSFT